MAYCHRSGRPMCVLAIACPAVPRVHAPQCAGVFGRSGIHRSTSTSTPPVHQHYLACAGLRASAAHRMIMARCRYLFGVHASATDPQPRTLSPPGRRTRQTRTHTHARATHNVVRRRWARARMRASHHTMRVGRLHAHAPPEPAQHIIIVIII